MPMPTSRQLHADALADFAGLALTLCPPDARAQLMAAFGRTSETAGAVFQQLASTMDDYHEARTNVLSEMKRQTSILERLAEQGAAAALERNPLCRRPLSAPTSGLPG